RTSYKRLQGWLNLPAQPSPLPASVLALAGFLSLLHFLTCWGEFCIVWSGLVLDRLGGGFAPGPNEVS
ncbi:MAG: hypothetical protein ACK53L_10330, partial [Pirellulaceae bacterium]